MMRSKSQLSLAVVACLLLLLGIIAYFGDSVEQHHTEQLAVVQSAGIGQLTPDGPAEQRFVCGENGLSQLSVMFSNYNRKIKSGSLTLTLRDEGGQTVATQTWDDISSLKNYVYISMDVPVQDDSKGKVYTLTAASDCTDQRGVTLRMGEEANLSDDFQLTLADGTIAEGSCLTMNLTYTSSARGTLALATLLLLSMCVDACILLPGRKEAHHA